MMSGETKMPSGTATLHPTASSTEHPPAVLLDLESFKKMESQRGIFFRAIGSDLSLQKVILHKIRKSKDIWEKRCHQRGELQKLFRQVAIEVYNETSTLLRVVALRSFYVRVKKDLRKRLKDAIEKEGKTILEAEDNLGRWPLYSAAYFLHPNYGTAELAPDEAKVVVLGDSDEEEMSESEDFDGFEDLDEDLGMAPVDLGPVDQKPSSRHLVAGPEAAGQEGMEVAATPYDMPVFEPAQFTAYDQYGAFGGQNFGAYYNGPSSSTPSTSAAATAVATIGPAEEAALNNVAYQMRTIAQKQPHKIAIMTEAVTRLLFQCAVGQHASVEELIRDTE